MAWVEGTANDSSDARMSQTLNGPQLFTTGMFYCQYGQVSYNTSTTETSIIWNQAAATANTRSVPPYTTALSMTNDATGQGAPGSSLFLSGYANGTTPYGALTLGTVIQGKFFGSIKNNSSTPAFTVKLLLRNASTGAVAYTLSSKAITMVSTASATGVTLDWDIQVLSVGLTGSVGVTGMFLSDAWAKPASVYTATTVDTSQNYILDATVTFDASSANNATVLSGFFKLIG